jgi:hypothetical protein
LSTELCVLASAAFIPALLMVISSSMPAASSNTESSIPSPESRLSSAAIVNQARNLPGTARLALDNKQGFPVASDHLPASFRRRRQRVSGPKVSIHFPAGS